MARGLGLGVLLLGVIGLLARALVAWVSYGSNDMSTWAGFASVILARSLGYLYDTDELFNHPPLMALAGSWLYALAAWSELRFEVLFKLPVILADVLSAILIYDLWKRRDAERAALALVLFCWNPASLLVTGYHGNTDSLCAGLTLLSVLFVDRKHALRGGLALAAAINVKLIPVLIIPVLLGSTRSWKQARRFMFGLSLGVVPFVPVAIGHWPGFHAHVLNYRSYAGEWGITGILTALGTNAHWAPVTRVLNEFWIARGSAFVLLMPVLLALINLLYLRRRWNARVLAAIAFGFFVVLAPGWGIQYIIYLVPLLFVVDLRLATVYATMAGVYAFVVYFSLWTGERPFYSYFFNGMPFGGQLIGYFVWAVALRTVFELLGRDTAAVGGHPAVRRLAFCTPPRSPYSQ